MEKNVIVTDEFGNAIGSTYPKRARGLVKNGRAELISEHEIRLSSFCPPNHLEDFFMSDKIIQVNTETGELIESADKMFDEALGKNGVIPPLPVPPIPPTPAAPVAPAAPEEAPDDKVRLYFKTRDYRLNPDCPHNMGERTMLSGGVEGELTEAYCIGSWQTHWTEIMSKDFALAKNTTHTLSFWLNGGENDRGDEVCQLWVIFDGDYENRYIYKLNRNFLKPVKRHNGWLLFEIPFTTEDNEATQFRFAAKGAPCAIIPAKEKAAYARLSDDKVDFRLPQRHNIVFNEGWPRDAGWSHMAFKGEFTDKVKSVFRGDKPEGDPKPAADAETKAENKSGFNLDIDWSKLSDTVSEKINQAASAVGVAAHHAKDAASNIKVRIFKSASDEINDEIDGFVDEIQSEIDEGLDEIEDEIDGMIDEIEDEIRGEVREELKDKLKDEIIDEIMSRLRGNSDKK